MKPLSNPLTPFPAAWDYVRWADGRMLEAAASIPDPAEYALDRGISHGSAHAVLLHMMAAQILWLRAWRQGLGRNAGAELPAASPAACPSLAAIAGTWPAVHDAVADFLRALTPADLAAPVPFTRRDRQLSLPLADTIAHLLDHATYHRGQLNSLVKLAGGQPVWTSYWIYALRLHPQPAGPTDADFR